MAAKTKKKAPAPTESKYGWHFILTDHLLGYGDGRKVEVGDRLEMRILSDLTGKPIKTKLEPRLCSRGMHASESLADAVMQYAPGPVLCRVTVDTGLKMGTDKFCGRFRTVHAMVDFTPYLQSFFLDCLRIRRGADSATGKAIIKAAEVYFKTGVVTTLPHSQSNSFYAVQLLLDGHSRPLSCVRDVFTLDKKNRAWAEEKLLQYAKKAGLLAKE